MPEATTTPSRRDFSEVLDAVIAKIPPAEKELLRRLNHIKKDIGFTAPEAQWPVRGREVAAILCDALDGKEPADGWRVKMLATWRGQAGPVTRAP